MRVQKPSRHIDAVLALSVEASFTTTLDEEGMWWSSCSCGQWACGPYETHGRVKQAQEGHEGEGIHCARWWT